MRPISAAIWQRATIMLPDGTPLAVRQIQPADAAALQRLHARLSACTSYRRFLHVLPELSEEQARSLANVYEFDGFALVALDPEQPDEIIAVARYARNPGTEQAELAMVVEDRWQRRGLGRALIGKLIEAARERGITSFSALVLRENTSALALLKRLGLPERSRSVDGAVECIEIDLRPEGLQTRLGAFWPGPRVPKTALAIALAWWGGQLLGEPQPIFAAIAALYGVQPTVAASLRKSVGQLLGIVIGTLLALLASLFLPALSPVTIGLAALLALVVTVRPGAKELLGVEAAVTALFVLAFGQGQPLWGLHRLWEVAVGGGVAIVVNTIVLPPTYLTEARQAVHRLTRQLVEHTRVAVTDLLIQPPEAEVRAHLLAVRDAVQQADELVSESKRAREALRFSPLLRYGPLHRGTEDATERFAHGVETLAAALLHARTAMRAAWQATRRPSQAEVAALDWHVVLDALVHAIARFEAYLVWGTPDALEAARRTLERALSKHADFLLEVAALPADVWDVDRAAALSELEHILDDLAVALKLKPSGATLAPTA